MTSFRAETASDSCHYMLIFISNSQLTIHVIFLSFGKQSEMEYDYDFNFIKWERWYALL